jgi:3',5'-cyclic AMP phosphodiesterase CpdA
MTTIAHISDLHFGAVVPDLAEGIILDLEAEQPDLVVVSGDLTQRARKSQFVAARSFLDRLSFPKLVVPGNHDIPLFDVFRRFLKPLARFREYINDDVNPFCRLDADIAVYGINTARSLTWKSGRISIKQMRELEQTVCPLPDDIFKVVVTHHPFIPPPDDDGIQLVGRSAETLTILEKCEVDLLLAGHLHQGYSGDVRPYYPKTRHSILVVQAGTAISRRNRRHPNGYNLIKLEPENIMIQVRQWNENRFTIALADTYEKKDREWIKSI